MSGSAADVGAQADRTICMVETTVQAEEVIAGERGVMHTVRPGHIVLCMSTIDPLAARRLGERLSARGIAMLDAPVSGGTERAASGELSIIVGGAAERSWRAGPLAAPPTMIDSSRRPELGAAADRGVEHRDPAGREPLASRRRQRIDRADAEHDVAGADGVHHAALARDHLLGLHGGLDHADRPVGLGAHVGSRAGHR